MSPVELLSRMRSHDIRLWAEEGELRYSAPKGAITHDLLAEIRAHKEELLEQLKSMDRFRRAVPLSPVKRTMEFSRNPSVSSLVKIFPTMRSMVVTMSEKFFCLD